MVAAVAANIIWNNRKVKSQGSTAVHGKMTHGHIQPVRLAAEHQAETHQPEYHDCPTQASMKFFIITLTAFLARDIPLSSKRKPSLHKEH
jgi:hypothetical protein